jgi:hypothetical protein
MKHITDYIYIYTHKKSTHPRMKLTQRESTSSLFLRFLSFFFYINIKNILKNNRQSYFQINFNLLIATFIAYLSLSSYPLSPISFIFIFQSHDLLFFYFTIIVDM